MRDDRQNKTPVEGVGFQDDVDFYEDFVAHELLPPELRRAVADYPFKISSADVLGYFEACRRSQFVSAVPAEERHDLAVGMAINQVRYSCRETTRKAYHEFGHDDPLPSMLEPV